LQGELQHTQADLDRAISSARTDKDRADVAAARELADQLKAQWQSQLDQAFLGQYDDFDKRLTQIERDKYADAETLESKVSACKESLLQWEAASNHVSPALLSRIRTLNERLTAIGKGTQQQKQDERDQHRITETIGEPAVYVKALQEHIQKNPGTDRTTDFTHVVEESPCWGAIMDWNKFARQWNRTGLVGLRPATASEQATLASAVLDAFADHPESDSLRQVLPYLKSIARRENGGERLETPLKKLFSDPLMVRVWMIEKATGERYYVNTEWAGEGDLPKPFKYVIGFDGKERGGLLVPSTVQSSGRAPQVAVAEQIQQSLDSLDDGDWEQSYCQMLGVIYKDQQLDPILKVNLLQKVSDTGIRGSYCLEKVLARQSKWFKEANIDAFANWLDPTDPAGANVRGEATRKLKSFPDADGSLRAVEQDRATLKQHRMTEYSWVGWLYKTRDEHWKCLMNRVPDESGSLFVLCRQTAKQKPTLSKVGRFDRQAAIIDTTMKSMLVEGRPVYLAIP
jgi:hypothetical protein